MEKYVGRSILGLIIIIAFFTTLPGIVSSAQIDDVRSDVNSLNCPAFGEYSMLNEMKNRINLMLYGKASPQTIDFAKEVVSFTKGFCQIYDSVDNVNDENLHAKAINDILTLRNNSDYLSQTRDNPLGTNAEKVAKSSELAVKTFLQSEGDYYALKAEKETITSKKIYYLKKASLAYENSGEKIKAVDLKTDASTLERRYNEDLNKAKKYFNTASKKFNKGLKAANKGHFYKINSYMILKDAEKNYLNALHLYEFHNEIEKQEKIKEHLESVKAKLEGLIYDIAILIFIIAISLIVISAFLIYRLKIWKKDKYDASLGTEFRSDEL